MARKRTRPKYRTYKRQRNALDRLDYLSETFKDKLFDVRINRDFRYYVALIEPGSRRELARCA